MTYAERSIRFADSDDDYDAKNTRDIAAKSVSQPPFFHRRRSQPEREWRRKGAYAVEIARSIYVIVAPRHAGRRRGSRRHGMISNMPLIRDRYSADTLDAGLMMMRR